MTEYETKITQITVKPEGKPIFTEGVTHITIEDEGSGEYVVLTQHGNNGEGKIAINPDEWPTLRDAIDKMVAGCEL